MHRLMESFKILVSAFFIGLWLLPTQAAEGKPLPIAIILSADTRGEVWECKDCAKIQQTLGGITRRATFIEELRQKIPELLLLDAGNALFGADSLTSQGQVIVETYQQIGYDVMNLSYRDFRLGKAATVNLIQRAPNLFVSANLLDAKGGKTLTQPFVIKSIGGIRCAVIGVTQIPAGLSYLPHLQEQLNGITIQPPEEALTLWLPKAKRKADRVLLLYYGSYGGLNPIQERFGKDFYAILVGGSRPEYLPANTIPPIVGTYDKGQYLARVQLASVAAEAKAEVAQIPVEATIVPDEEIEKILAEFKPEVARPATTVPSQKRETKQPRAKKLSIEKEGEKKLAEASDTIVIGERLRVGMPIADAMALLGMPEGMRSTGTGAEKIQWMDYPTRGIAIGARPGGKTLERIEVQLSFGGRLASGVRMGDHYTTVITKHGMPAAMTPEGARYPDQGLVFRLQDEKVVAVEVSLVAEVAKEAAKKVEEAAPPAPKFTPTEANNKAVRVEISDITFTGAISEQQAPRGKTFLIIETRWENIHPKQKVDKDKAKGKRDPTMGVSGLGFGGSAKKTEYVEADVPYQVERLYDHAYALADGLAFVLHSMTDKIAGGVPRRQRFTIAKHGEVREAKLVFMIPKDAKNVAFQFFDYRFGHVAMPIQGDLELAQGAKGPAEVLAQGKTDLGEFIVKTVDFQDAYAGKSAPQGWHYAVVGLGGKNLLEAKNMRNIVQIDPFKNTWVSSQDACLYYCSHSDTAERGRIRFTPEVYQFQELAFLVPASERTFDLSIRLQNDVTRFRMTKAKPKLPGLLATHRDGSVMEVMVFGVRKADGKQIVDLAIQSLEPRKGIQIQPSRQFMLIAGRRETGPDKNATTALFRRPPEPFIVPPGTLVRFELAYDTQAEPTALRYQGYQSDMLIALKAAERPEETPKPAVSKAPADTQTFGGHRYKAVAVPEGITWEEAKARAEAMGGYLAVITNDAENTFLHVLVVRDNSLWSVSANNNGLGPWLGGYQPVSASEPKGDWSWVNGETWNFTKWAQKEPNNRNGNEDRLHFFGPGKPRGPYWNDIYHGTKLKGFIVEFDGPVGEKPKPLSEEAAAVTTKSNKCVELAVVDYILQDRIGDIEAGEGQAFVVVSTRWKNITQPKEAPPWAHRSLKTAGQVRPKEFVPVELRLSDDFYLVAGGKRLAPDSSVANTLPKALPNGKLMLPKPGDQLEGAAAFLVRKDDLSSLLLVYFDKKNGDIEIPLMASGERIAKKPDFGGLDQGQVEIPAAADKGEKDREPSQLTVAGEWKTGTGFMVLEQKGIQIKGNYDEEEDQGEISGELRGDSLVGYWIQEIGNRRCDTPLNGKYYWGRVEMVFDGAGHFLAKWGYCEEDPTRSDWTGTKMTEGQDKMTEGQEFEPNDGKEQREGEISLRGWNREGKWTVWDDPSSIRGPSKWRFGLAEVSGITNKENKVATALIAGETTWQNYSVETTLFTLGSRGKREYISVFLFGYQDPLNFYHVGYDLKKNRFELEVRTPRRFETLAVYSVRLPLRQEIPLRLEFASGRIRFLAKNRTIFDIDHRRYLQGQIGLAAAGVDSGRVLIGPVTVTAVDPMTLPEREPQDIMAARRGATLVSVTDKGFSKLIDRKIPALRGNDSYHYDYTYYVKEQERQAVAVFGFPQERHAEIHQIEFKGLSTNIPAQVEILVSTADPQEKFDPIDILTVEPGGPSDRVLTFEPVSARYLKIRITPKAQKGRFRIQELSVYGYLDGLAEKSAPEAAGPYSAKAETILFHDDFSTGQLEGWKQWDDPKAKGAKGLWSLVVSEFSGIENTLGKSSTLLTTGESNWANYAVEVELFRAGNDGYLTGLIFGHQDEQHFYHVGYNQRSRRFELEKRSPEGFHTLAFAEMKLPKNRWIPLRVAFGGGRIVFQADNRDVFDLDDAIYDSGKAGIDTCSLNKGLVLLRNFRVTAIEPAARPQRKLQDLLALRRGAGVIYSAHPDVGNPAVQLLDHSLARDDDWGYPSFLRSAKLPMEAVFCFPQGRVAEIHRIGFKIGSQEFPKEISLWVSNRTPKAGFKHLKTVTITPKPYSYQEFDVPPTRAKYLKIQLSTTYEQRAAQIREMLVKGFFEVHATEPGGQKSLGEVQRQELEPNNNVEQAEEVPLKAYIGASVPVGDTDCFLLNLSPISGDVLTIEINHVGAVRPSAELVDINGNPRHPSERVTEGWLSRLTYKLKPQKYFLKVSRPATYLTIVFDDSGSMGKSVPTVKRVLKGYLNNLGEDLYIKLMKYAEYAVELSDFTRDPNSLAAAIDSQVRGGGGTQTFRGLMAAIESVKSQHGNRAVLAVLDHFDGNRNHELYVKLWDEVLDADISFTTIGVRGGWDYDREFFGNLRSSIFQELAYSTQGQFFHSPLDKQVQQSAQTLLSQLTGSVPYRFKATWEQKVREPGFIQILFEEGAEKKTEKNVELILDASNSMWGQIEGESKITSARSVLERIISGLPEGMNVGLRVYGHRYGLKDKRACKDTTLMVPIERVAKGNLINSVNKVKPKGKTPLVYSVLQAVKDFEHIAGGSIILISDGIESCGGDIESIGPALAQSKLKLKVHIVGFGIKEADARKELEAIAESTGGKYFDAKDPKGLLASLEEALKVEYMILDQQGQASASGFVGGDPVKVMEGTYTLQLLLEPELLETEVVIEPKEVTVLLLKREQDKWTILPTPSRPPVKRVVTLEKGVSLGINVEDAAAGLRIAAVEAGSVGEAAGLRVDDFITHIDGEPVKSRQNFIAAIRKVSLGKRKQVTVSIRCGPEVISLAVGSMVMAPEPETTTVERERKKGLDPQILNVQRCLRQVGFDPGPADGLWGKKTAEAVREFQKWYPHQKLTVTGKLDEQTYAALLKADTQRLRRDAYKKSSLEPSTAKKRDEAEARQKEEERRAEQRRKAEEQRRAEEKRKEEVRRQNETDKIIEKGKKIFRDIFKF